MPSPLERLAAQNQHLLPEPWDGKEYLGLIASGEVRLKDSQNVALSLESRFDLAYNAAHALSLAALRRHGYRAKNRYIVFQVLPHTLGLGPEVWRILAKCHDVRNIAEYEGTLDIEARIVTDLIHAAQQIQTALINALPLSP